MNIARKQIGILILFALFSFTFIACDEETGQFEEKETTSANEEVNTEQERDTEADAEASDEASLANQEKDTKEEETNKEEDTSKSVQAEMDVHYMDAGQADATLFQYEDDDDAYTILYDAGDWNKRDVVDYLAAQDIEFIDLIIISHPHADHIGQLATIMKTYDVGEVWMTENENSSATFQDAVEAVLESDADYDEPKAGEAFTIGTLDLEVLHPNDLTGDLNQDSLSVRFTYGDVSFMFTGDAYKEQELEMMQSADDVEADVLQLGHHGSKTSSHPNFVDAVDPDIAIYSAGEDNSYGHPSEETITLLEDRGIDLYGTDVHGAIIVSTDGSRTEVKTNQDGDIQPGSTEPIEEEENHSNEDTEEPEEESPENCIDINAATVEEVQGIIHIGPERAKDVIDNRPYESVDDLSAVDGIGPARIKDIKEENNACVGG